MVKTLLSQCRGLGSIPDQGTKIPHATWPGQKMKERERERERETEREKEREREREREHLGFKNTKLEFQIP